MTKPMLNPDLTEQLKVWQVEVNVLCHDIFFQSDKGQKLLALWEQRYFYAPVADPNVSMDYARFHEGRNNFIRGIRAAAYAAMKPPEATTLKKDIEHEREDDGI